MSQMLLLVTMVVVLTVLAMRPAVATVTARAAPRLDVSFRLLLKHTM